MMGWRTQGGHLVDTNRRRPTLADVAKLSGVSPSAASKILNNRPNTRLSADTTQKVRAAAEELGYRANPVARGLRLSTTRTIGFVSDRVTTMRYASGMIRGALEAADDDDYTVLIAETDGQPQKLRRAIETMVDRRVDGIVVGITFARLIEAPHPPGLPLVVCNGRTPDALPCVLPDEYEAGKAVAETLLRAGHRHIGLIGELPPVFKDPRWSVTISTRFKGMNDALNAAGVSPVKTVVPEWRADIGYENALNMMHQHPDITALITATDNVAFGAYRALSELNLKIPYNVSVVSFDDEELAEYLRPGLTTARLPYDEMARRATRQVLGHRPFGEELVPMPMIIRESVARVE